jgi:hypothetical protein
MSMMVVMISRSLLVTVVKKERIKVILRIGNLEIRKILVIARKDVRRKIGVMHLLSIMKIRIVISTLKIQLKR